MSSVNDIIKHLNDNNHPIKFIQDTLIADLGLKLSYTAIRNRLRNIRLYPNGVPKQLPRTTLVTSQHLDIIDKCSKFNQELTAKSIAMIIKRETGK